MNRRDMIKTGAAALAATAVTPALAAPTSVAKWELFEVTLKGPSAGNPFRDVQLGATFTQGNRTVKVTGFYDGNGAYKVRFMPDATGTWTYTTQSTTAALNGKSGTFTVTAPLKDSHGPVGVRNGHHFGHADGTPFFPFGTTCYAWIHQSDALQKQTLDSLAKGPFNKIRMCVFPKHYEYNHNEPALYPFERDAAGKNDFTRPNPAFYAHLEQRIADLRAIGFESDLILFHPYDRWGFATMSAQDDDAYLRYLLSRLSAYPNIWWSLANEYDFMKAKTMADWDRFFHIVETEDPYSHLRSVHHGSKPYDYSHPWVTHASLQVSDFEKTGERIANWRKPIDYDEVQYEGNLNRRWGNLSGEEMTWRSWRAIIAGGYVTHGETLLDEKDAFNEDATPTLWWSHGGTLKGQSPARIGFLRKLVEDTAKTGGVVAGLEADTTNYYTNARSMLPDGKTVASILYFTDYHAPIWYEFPLPDGAFRAEYIDPWAMTITPIDGTFKGNSKIKLNGKPYQAVRFIRV